MRTKMWKTYFNTRKNLSNLTLEYKIEYLIILIIIIIIIKNQIIIKNYYNIKLNKMLNNIILKILLKKYLC